MVSEVETPSVPVARRRRRRLGLMREASTVLAIVALLAVWAVIAAHG